MEHPKNKTNLHFKWQPALFLLVLLTVYFALGFQNIVRERPQSVHQWAQCDRASVAMVMHKEGISFSKPQTHNIENSTGITGMEFPFVNACAATLYNVFGPYEALYRLIILAFVTVGLLAAYMFTFDITGNALTAGLIVLLFFLSPVLVYYTPNFIPDSPSMALILVFWLFFLRYLKQPSWGLLFLLGIIGLLASLIKISSLLSIITALCIVLLALAGQLKKHVSLNRKFSYGAIGVLLFIGMSTYGWYSYAAWLNAVYHSDVFIMHAPIVTNPNKIGELFTIAMDEWGYQYYSTPVHILWGLLAIACIALWKKLTALWD
ncbi:MAG: glycosyltransferase family 39 protein [Sphingobacteriales bacterium JAD_PAG50586_3]|nr:MAG: glycosyltransferase family 39 protein [Sphingobacteriales bacterium JAD_PAG50586_3]